MTCDLQRDPFKALIDSLSMAFFSIPLLRFRSPRLCFDCTSVFLSFLLSFSLSLLLPIVTKECKKYTLSLCALICHPLSLYVRLYILGSGPKGPMTQVFAYEEIFSL